MSDETGALWYGKAVSQIVNDEEVLLLSITRTYHLPERAIEEGAKQQIWYSGQSAPKDATKATFVREYLTREILQNHVQGTGMDLRVFNRSELEMVLSSFVDDKLKQRRCEAFPDECGPN